MTTELKEMLHKAIEDEIMDMRKYIDMSKIAKHEDLCQLAGVLLDIAAEEQSHRDLLEYFLNKL